MRDKTFVCRKSGSRYKKAIRQINIAFNFIVPYLDVFIIVIIYLYIALSVIFIATKSQTVLSLIFFVAKVFSATFLPSASLTFKNFVVTDKTDQDILNFYLLSILSLMLYSTIVFSVFDPSKINYILVMPLTPIENYIGGFIAIIIIMLF